jgi:hypothetical protein
MKAHKLISKNQLEAAHFAAPVDTDGIFMRGLILKPNV